MTLYDLPKNQSATILSCPDKRLCEMGIIPDAQIRMVKPGLACIVYINNTRLCLGMEYQKIITIIKGK